MRVAVVTGGASGIGESVCRALAADGLMVVVADLNRSAADDLAARICTYGQAMPVGVDVARPASVEALFAHVQGETRRLDVLVNCAGVTAEIDFFSANPDDWDRIMGVNAQGTLMTMQHAATAMSDSGGRIINIAALAGKGWSGASNIVYAASKGAVITMTRIAAGVLASRNITVNAVCPGITLTPLVTGVVEQRAHEGRVDASEVLQLMTAKIPLGRPNVPDDIADTVRFLASEAARNITGQSLNVDGGLVYD